MDLNQRLEAFFEDYQQQRQSVAELHNKMQTLTATATSPRREVSVTVGQNGVLSDIRFPTGAHKRLTTADLTSLILATYNEARLDVQRQSVEALKPLMPEGADVEGLMEGKGLTDTFMPEEPQLPMSIREFLNMGRSDK